MMQITVQTTSKLSTRNVAVFLDRCDTIGSLRDTLEIQEGWLTDAGGQLTWDRRVLSDSVSIDSLGIDSEKITVAGDGSTRFIHLARYQFDVVINLITGKTYDLRVTSNLPVSDIAFLVGEREGYPAASDARGSMRFVVGGQAPCYYNTIEDSLIRPGSRVNVVWKLGGFWTAVALWDWDGDVQDKWLKGRPISQGEIIYGARFFRSSIYRPEDLWLYTDDGLFPTSYVIVTQGSPSEVKYALTKVGIDPPPSPYSFLEEVDTQNFTVSLGNYGRNTVGIQCRFKPHPEDYYPLGHYHVEFAVLCNIPSWFKILTIFMTAEFDDVVVVGVEDGKSVTWEVQGSDLGSGIQGLVHLATLTNEPRQMKIKITVSFDLGGGSRIAEVEERRILRVSS
ncbi:hypothetical protein DL96DRAFT_1812979 [Flagelloscypha sp. PMI_526]|nr:hypothetical protein DL96DRAFT_1812979 [Flagelloscypha sp. PMI_526]